MNMETNDKMEEVIYKNKRTGHEAVRRLSINALMLAFLILCSQIVIPIGPIPITLQTLSVAVIAYTLLMKDSVIVLVSYLVLGFLGLPFFAGFTGGPAKLFSASAGYLVGFIPMLILLGLASRQFEKSKFLTIVLSALGLLTCHLFGVIWLAKILEIGYWEAFTIGSLPFLIKDGVSLIVAFFIAVKLNEKLHLDQV